VLFAVSTTPLDQDEGRDGAHRTTVTADPKLGGEKTSSARMHGGQCAGPHRLTRPT